MKQSIYLFLTICFSLFLFNNHSQAQIANGCYVIKNVEDNKYISHNGGGSIEYYANRGTADGWEKFYITNVDGKVTIYGEDGKYLSAQQAGLVWKAGQPQAWEKWSYNGTYKTFTSHHGSQLYANSMDVLRTADYREENKGNPHVMSKFLSNENPYHTYFQWIVEPSQGCKTP